MKTGLLPFTAVLAGNCFRRKGNVRGYPKLRTRSWLYGLEFKVDVEKERLQGYFKWGYNGPS